jgi:uncharacterized Zn-binding protein involved in type VI secretion
MPNAFRQGDATTGHACHFPPTVAQKGSPDVKTNGRDQMRVTDPCITHACPAGHPAPHPPIMSTGSSTVFVDGLKACRIGDSAGCGDKAAAGSPDVYIGG